MSIEANQIVYQIADVWDEPEEIPLPMTVVKPDGAEQVLCVDLSIVVCLGATRRADDKFVMNDDELRTAVDQARAAMRVERRRLGRDVFESPEAAIAFAVARREREQLEETAAV